MKFNPRTLWLCITVLRPIYSMDIAWERLSSQLNTLSGRLTPKKSQGGIFTGTKSLDDRALQQAREFWFTLWLDLEHRASEVARWITDNFKQPELNTLLAELESLKHRLREFKGAVSGSLQEAVEKSVSRKELENSIREAIASLRDSLLRYVPVKFIEPTITGWESNPLGILAGDAVLTFFTALFDSYKAQLISNYPQARDIPSFEQQSLPSSTQKRPKRLQDIIDLWNPRAILLAKPSNSLLVLRESLRSQVDSLVSWVISSVGKPVCKASIIMNVKGLGTILEELAYSVVGALEGIVLSGVSSKMLQQKIREAVLAHKKPLQKYVSAESIDPTLNSWDKDPLSIFENGALLNFCTMTLNTYKKTLPSECFT